jgi:uracil-DNA glycosylase
MAWNYNKTELLNPVFKPSEYIVCKVNEEYNKFIVEKKVLMEYLIGTPLLLCKESTKQTMYMCELDNLFDFLEWDEDNVFVDFKPDRYDYGNVLGFKLPEMLFPILKRFHWSWTYNLNHYFLQGDFRQLNMLLNVEARKHALIIPNKELIYASFTNFNFFDTKVVIIGGYPYSDEKDATGIAFQINHPKLTDSLKHINKAIKEINEDGIQYDLQNWINQGILLLNSSLTYQQGVKCATLWMPFLIEVIKAIDNLKHDVVYVLMGKQANELRQHIKLKQNVLECENPIVASMENREWKHNDVFRKIQNLTNIKL